jgi:hypothetical protein
MMTGARPMIQQYRSREDRNSLHHLKPCRDQNRRVHGQRLTGRRSGATLDGLIQSARRADGMCKIDLYRTQSKPWLVSLSQPKR